MTATYAKYTLQLNTVTDADVIEYLAAQANKNDTIRQLLRKQLCKEKYETDSPNWETGTKINDHYTL